MVITVNLGFLFYEFKLFFFHPGFVFLLFLSSLIVFSNNSCHQVPHYSRDRILFDMAGYERFFVFNSFSWVCKYHQTLLMVVLLWDFISMDSKYAENYQ